MKNGAPFRMSNMNQLQNSRMSFLCVECGLGLFFILYYMGSSHHCLGFKKRMNLPVGTEPDYLFNQGGKKEHLRNHSSDFHT